MSAGITTDAGGLTAAELGEQAARAVRALAHLTRPGLGALTDPADAAQLIAALAHAAGGLPQLLGQLAGWLTSEERAGRLRVDACCPPGGQAAAATREAVAEATTELARASRCAHAAGRALDAAHQSLARLASEPEGRP